jgi:hypothetical protein
MSMPRYTWRESALMISARGSRSASSSDRPVLPVAVAPAMTISGGSRASAVERAHQ